VSQIDLDSFPTEVQSFSRTKLFELVWSEPMQKIAKTLGLSDVGLAKLCRRARVPVPPKRLLG